MAKKRHRVGKRRRFKGSPQAMLTQMAIDIVGDGKTTDAFFVSEAGGGVVAFATSRAGAIGAAKALGNAKPILVEDESGEIWGNEAYERSQMGDDDE